MLVYMSSYILTFIVLFALIALGFSERSTKEPFLDVNEFEVVKQGKSRLRRHHREWRTWGEGQYTDKTSNWRRWLRQSGWT